jgi:hypothetical protein
VWSLLSAIMGKANSFGGAEDSPPKMISLNKSLNFPVPEERLDIIFPNGDFAFQAAEPRTVRGHSLLHILLHSLKIARLEKQSACRNACS